MNKSTIGKRGLIDTLLLVAIFCLLFSNVANAQWVKSYGGLWGEYAKSIQRTSDGGYIVTGWTATQDVWVVKLDPDGNIQWQKTYDGGNGDDRANSIQQTSDGGYILTGLTSVVSGGTDLWVVKLDPDGNIQWQKTYDGGNNFWDEGNCIRQTSDGGYIVAGWTWVLPAQGYEDAWVLKLDPNGNIQWQKTYGGGGEDHVYSIQQTSDGGYIMVGDTYSFEVGTPVIWVVKLDSVGNIQWQKGYDGIASSIGESIQQTTDGGYIVAVGAGIPNNIPYVVPWVLKLDSVGNIQWQKAYVGTKEDYALSVRQTTDGGYIMAGLTTSFGAGGGDAYVSKLDSNGNIQWQKTYGGINYDIAYFAQQTTDGGYVVAGYTVSFGAGNADVWVLKLDRNGDIRDCPIIGAANATAINTSLTVSDTDVTVANTGTVPMASAASVANTNAKETTVCAVAPLQSPIAEAGGPYSGTVGSQITFDASGSYDPDGTIVLYEWDWNNDGVYDESTTSPTISHVWSAPYSGNIRLRVTDNDGLTGIDTASVEVKEKQVRISGGAYFYPETPTYRASFSMDVTGPISPSGWLKYYYARTRMNFVSSGVTSVSASGNTATISGSGTVNGVGGYTFTATVTNGSPDSFAIVIKKPDGSTYYSAGPKNISGGDLVIQ